MNSFSKQVNDLMVEPLRLLYNKRLTAREAMRLAVTRALSQNEARIAELETQCHRQLAIIEEQSRRLAGPRTGE